MQALVSFQYRSVERSERTLPPLRDKIVLDFMFFKGLRPSRNPGSATDFGYFWGNDFNFPLSN